MPQMTRPHSTKSLSKLIYSVIGECRKLKRKLVSYSKVESFFVLRGSLEIPLVVASISHAMLSAQDISKV